jgi:hypothetical protein
MQKVSNANDIKVCWFSTSKLVTLLFIDYLVCIYIIEELNLKEIKWSRLNRRFFLFQLKRDKRKA